MLLMLLILLILLTRYRHVLMLECKRLVFKCTCTRFTIFERGNVRKACDTHSHTDVCEPTNLDLDG